jgi:hypothetical protein
MSRKRGPLSELKRAYKRACVEDRRIQNFAACNEVEIEDPRHNAPTEIVVTVWRCITGKTPKVKPGRVTEERYRNEVFDWWDQVKKNRRISSSNIRSQLLMYVPSLQLKKLGIYDILYDFHCPSSPTDNDERQSLGNVRCEKDESNDDANWEPFLEECNQSPSISQHCGDNVCAESDDGKHETWFYLYFKTSLFLEFQLKKRS